MAVLELIFGLLMIAVGWVSFIFILMCLSDLSEYMKRRMK